LDPPITCQLAALLELIVSDPHAPTSVREPGRVLDDHLADSLVALELGPVREASLLADLGSGGGLPGLPLAVALAPLGVTVVDSSRRKVAFMLRAIEKCGIVNARAVHARAEDWAEGVSRFDVITARAVAPLDVLAEYAAPLLRLGGSLVAWRGRREPEGEAHARRAALALGLETGEIRPVQPYPGARHRHLHLMKKVRDTPAEFPRRPGVARKRPLGLSPPASDRGQR
jgi:16S rRNA (guanine527-N7)-methyltransferase